MNVVSPNRAAILSRWRPAPLARGPSPYRPAAWPPSSRLGQQLSPNPLDWRVVSFAANLGGTILSFSAAPKFDPGFWRTLGYTVGVILALRTLNDFGKLTGAGLQTSS